MNNGSKTGLALDNGVRDTHLAAERGEPHNNLDGVDIVGNDNELGLFVLNQCGDVVDSVLDHVGLLTLIKLLALGGRLGNLDETSLFLLLGLGTVLVEELEGLSGGVLVQNLCELVVGWGNLQALTENGSLALKTDVFGPLNETREVSLGLHILANSEVLGIFLEKRVFGSLGDLALLDGRGRGGGLLSFRGLLQGVRLTASVDSSL